MSIDDWRREIDDIDREIVRLLNARARIVIKVGNIKCAAGIPFCDPMRELEVMKQVHEWNQGPLDARHSRDSFVALFANLVDWRR